MKSRGLGDSIHKFTKATGIKRMVDTVSQGLNIPCGCEGRREAMNAKQVANALSLSGTEEPPKVGIKNIGIEDPDW